MHSQTNEEVLPLLEQGVPPAETAPSYRFARNVVVGFACLALAVGAAGVREQNSLKQAPGLGTQTYDWPQENSLATSCEGCTNEGCTCKVGSASGTRRASRGVHAVHGVWSRGAVLWQGLAPTGVVCSEGLSARVEERSRLAARRSRPRSDQSHCKNKKVVTCDMGYCNQPCPGRPGTFGLGSSNTVNRRFPMQL